MPNNAPRALSQVLEDAIHSLDGDTITFKHLIENIGTRAYGILLLILTLPNAIPVAGVVGISALTGMLMLIFSAQMAFAVEKPWLPKFLAEKEIGKAMLLRALRAVAPYLAKIEPFIKPRMLAMSSPIGLRVTGWFIAGFCLVLLLPIPLSNFGPAVAIFLIGLGMLEKDGVFMTIGLVLGVVYCTILIWFLSELIKGLFPAF